jgi:signal transduction histidine kinase
MDGPQKRRDAEKDRAAVCAPQGQPGNSPALQCREQGVILPSPGGTAETSSDSAVPPGLLFSRTLFPALKCRAIFMASRWDARRAQPCPLETSPPRTTKNLSLICVSASLRPILLLCLLSCTLLIQAAEPLTSIAVIRSMPRAESGKRMPVLVRGVVTFRWPVPWNSFCIQSDEGGLWISTSIARQEKILGEGPSAFDELREGDEVEVTGVLDAGGYAPDVLPTAVRIISHRGLPQARTVPFTRLLTGAEDPTRVEVAGVVQRVSGPTSARWLVELETGVGRVLAHVPDGAGFDPRTLTDAEVRLRGVAASSRNWRAEFVRPRVLVASPEDVLIDRAAPTDPFAAPATAIADLASYAPDGRSLHRRRVTGVVTWSDPLDGIYLQDGLRAIRVDIIDRAHGLVPGDRVEVSGFIDASNAVAGLRGAVVRKLDHPGELTPLSSTLADAQQVFEPVRRGRPAGPHDFDHLLIRVEGRLLAVQRDASEQGRQLVLDCGGLATMADLSGDATALDALTIGSRVTLTGVAVMHYDRGEMIADYIAPLRMDLRLRTAQDVRVVQAAPWWTPARLAIAIGVMGAVLIAAVAWIVSLRRSLRLRSMRLEEVMRLHRDAELEYRAVHQERRRLAADMHDGLQQLLMGAAFRLEAANARLAGTDPAVAEQLSAARAALLRTQDGLRDCLWGLRHVDQAEDGPRQFAGLLERAAEAMEHWPRGALTVTIAGEPYALSRHVMGSLLLLMQEAVGNSFKHGAAKQVRISLYYTPTEFAMELVDDGAGFDAAAAPGTTDGHYGLESMRHRMHWLGGDAAITSRPGAGTTVSVHLPRARAQSGDDKPQGKAD